MSALALTTAHSAIRLAAGMSDPIAGAGFAHEPIALHLHDKHVTVEHNAGSLALQVPGQNHRFIPTEGVIGIEVQLSRHHWLLVHRHTAQGELHLRLVRISDKGEAFGQHVVVAPNGKTTHTHVTPKAAHTQPRPKLLGFGHDPIRAGWTYESNGR